MELQGLCWTFSSLFTGPASFTEMVEAPSGCHTGRPSHHCTIQLLSSIEEETQWLLSVPRLWDPGGQCSWYLGQVVIEVDGNWKPEHKKIRDLGFGQLAYDPELGCSV